MSALFRRPDGAASFPSYDLGPLSASPGVEVRQLPPMEILAEDVSAEFDVLIAGPEQVVRESFATNVRLALIARVGAGFDRIDISACTDHGVAVTTTPEAVKRPMAVANLTLVLALAGKLLTKDRIVRRGAAAWAERMNHHGLGLVGRTLGSIGLGNIGAEVFRLARGFGFRLIATDPYVDRSLPANLGAEMVSLETLFAESDFLMVNCPLTDETRGIVSRERIALMKQGAYLINAARGPLVDQAALSEALVEGRIAGAALDTFDPEPPHDDDPLLTLDNVILTPHSLGWTDQMFAGIAAAHLAAIEALMRGQAPDQLINPEVVPRRSFRHKLSLLSTQRS